MNKKIVLKQGKERPIQNRHQWIFSGAIEYASQYINGEILPVYTYKDELLGHAYFNKGTVIAGRMMSFNNDEPIITLKQNIKKAIILRYRIFDESTNCFRVINGEGDNISGLVVDKYNDTLVIQIVSVGIDKLKDLIVKELINDFKEIFNLEINCVYEKSTIHARKKDGLESFEGVLYGKLPEKLVAIENNIKFIVDINQSQKTGLFLDQREMRELVGNLTKNKSLLNCFSYTGGFSLYASRNNATQITSVDISPEAINNSVENFKENNFNTSNNKFIAQDAFTFLHEDPLQYDFIILDPPAFAKKKEDIEKAKRGYRDINRTTLRKMPKESFLLTCSCSYHIAPEMFEKVIMDAAFDAKRNVKIIQKHRLGMDHPINIYHSEINYLKSLLLYVD